MTPGIEYALGAMLFFGLGDLVYKRGAAAGAQPHHFLMVQSWVFTPSVVLYAMLTGSLHFVAGSLWPRAAVVLALAFAFMVEGMARAEASVVVPIAQMGFVVTALLGFLFLREPFTARKGAGLAAALSSLGHG